MSGLEYVQLMASLPALGPILSAKSAPITALRLEKRLNDMLRPEHLAEIVAARGMLAWSHLPLLMSDDACIRQAETVMPALRNPTLRQLVQDRLTIRTVIAALRRREAGQDAPPADGLWGYGNVVGRIRKNWRDPAFGLGSRFRWIPPLRDKMSGGDAAGAERTILELAWRQADRLAGSHQFDFEAVAIYATRWNLLDRWTRYDAEIAAARFGELVSEAMATAPELDQPGVDGKEAAT